MATDKTTKPDTQKSVVEKTDMEILYPSVKINKYTIEPWGMFEIAQIVPYVYSIVEKCKSNNIKLTEQSILEIPKILPLVIDEITAIMAATLGVSVEEIKTIKPKQDTIAIILVIIKQNYEYLKNLQGLLQDTIATIMP